jgi:putative ABC transport system permease protein
MTEFLQALAGIVDLGTLQGLVFAGVAFSAVLSLLVLDFPDISIEGTFPLGAAVAAVTLAKGAPPAAAFVLAGLAGCAGGLLTGSLHVRLGMSKLLSGICTAAIFYSLNMWIMGGRANLPVLDVRTYFSQFEAIDSSVKTWLYPSRKLFFHPGSIFGCLLLVVALKLILDFILASEFGVILRGVGQNERAVRAYGHNPGNYKLLGLAMANALAALSGALAAQYQGFSDVNMGVGVLVMALVAVILGQELFARLGLGLGSPAAITRAALAGVIIHQMVLATVLRVGAPPTSLRLFAGLSRVAVIALRRRRSAVTFSW